MKTIASIDLAMIRQNQEEREVRQMKARENKENRTQIKRMEKVRKEQDRQRDIERRRQQLSEGVQRCQGGEETEKEQHECTIQRPALQDTTNLTIRRSFRVRKPSEKIRGN